MATSIFNRGSYMSITGGCQEKMCSFCAKTNTNRPKVKTKKKERNKTEEFKVAKRNIKVLFHKTK